MLLGITFSWCSRVDHHGDLSSTSTECSVQRFVRPSDSVLQTLAHLRLPLRDSGTAGRESILLLDLVTPVPSLASTILLLRQASPGSRVLQHSLLQDHSPTMMPSIIFFNYAVGPLVRTFHSDVPLLSAVVAVSGFALAFALALAFSLASFVLVAVPIGLATLEPFLPPYVPPSSLLPLVHPSAPFLRCHGPDPLGPFLPAPLPDLYPFPGNGAHVFI